MNKRTIARKYTAKYAAIQGAYWPAYCASCSFAAVFLLSRNFSSSGIGIIMAAANILSVFLQPMIASSVDKSSRASSRRLTALLGGLTAALILLRLLLPASDMIFIAIVFSLELSLLFTLQPFVNSLGMQLINGGIPINFGLARGIGSISFAIFSSFTGYLVDRFGADSSVILSLLMVLCLIFFTLAVAPDHYFRQKQDTSKNTEENSSGASLSIPAFLKRYKRFTLLLVAVAVTFSSHMLINNYTIQIIENVGGNTQNMGTALGIAAAIELPAMSLFMFFARKFKCSSILKFSFLFFVVKTVLTLLAVNVWMIYFAQLFQFFSYALFIPSSIYYVNIIIDKKDMVKGQSFITGAISVAGIIGSLLGGILLNGPGVRVLLGVGVIASVLGFLISIPAVEKTPDPHIFL